MIRALEAIAETAAGVTLGGIVLLGVTIVIAAKARARFVRGPR